jgi:N,N'-diacetyllegionaminate synthase
LKKTTIIAEAGVNHNGDLNLALKMIEIAASAGVDYVKFQSFNATKLVTKYAKKAAYQEESDTSSANQHEMLSKLELSDSQHLALVEHCQRNRVKFLSTAFDEESVDLLYELNQRVFKIPSGEITNVPLLRHIGSKGCEIILSTGMSTLGEIREAIECLIKVGVQKDQITILHCTSNYPTNAIDVNLNAMLTIQNEFKMSIGYSDHTLGIEVPTAAVALGATIIEKHFTLDRNLVGPDHKASLEPHELAEMVRAIRNVELAMGDGVKGPTNLENEVKMVARRSIVALRDIKKGEIFSPLNLTTKRPGVGLSPILWDKIIGEPAKRDFLEDELIEL